MQPDQEQYTGPGLPDELTPLTDPKAVEFKLAGGQAARGLEESGARAWLGLPVPPGKASRPRTINSQEVPNG